MLTTGLFGYAVRRRKQTLDDGQQRKIVLPELTFIGWALLASIPTGLIIALFPDSGFFAVIASLIAALPAIFVYEYVYVSKAAFYELLTERLVVVFPSAPTDNTVEINLHRVRTSTGADAGNSGRAD